MNGSIGNKELPILPFWGAFEFRRLGEEEIRSLGDLKFVNNIEYRFFCPLKFLTFSLPILLNLITNKQFSI